MEIKTERLTLVPFDTSFLEAAHKYRSDRELTRLMVFLPSADTAETMDYLLESEREWKKAQPSLYRFAVLLDGVLIGDVDLEYVPGGMEIGWIFSPEHHGRGYATEAARALTEFGRSLGATHFIAHCDTENTASRRVMEKLGFVRTGESGGRKNRSSDEERREYKYELTCQSEGNDRH